MAYTLPCKLPPKIGLNDVLMQFFLIRNITNNLPTNITTNYKHFYITLLVATEPFMDEFDSNLAGFSLIDEKDFFIDYYFLLNIK